MERVLVGLGAVTLLVAAASYSQADYIVVCQLAAPNSRSEQFPSARSLSGDPAENPSIPEALNRHIHVFANSRPLLVDFGDLSTFDADAVQRQAGFLPTLGDPVDGKWLKLYNQQFPIDGLFPSPFSMTGLPDVQLDGVPGLGASLFEAAFIADTIDLSGEIPTGESFLARFGGLDLGDTQSAEPPRVVPGPAGSSPGTSWLSDIKVLSSLSLAVLALLAFLGYVWQRRRRRLRHILRGPRRTMLYRSPSLPWPPGRAP